MDRVSVVGLEKAENLKVERVQSTSSCWASHTKTGKQTKK